jgi:plasmid stabilization system protein ParE
MARPLGYRCGDGSANLPQVILTAGAVAGLERCRKHLASHDPEAARRAAAAIRHRLRMLEQSPEMGRRVTDAPDLRELVIPFGRLGYVALYHHDAKSDRLLILALRHQKEAGY